MIARDTNISKSIIPRLLSCVPMIIAMSVVSIYHGDSQTATMIADSWSITLGINPETLIPKDTINGHEVFSGAIGSLSWTTQDAISLHKYINFEECSLGVPGYISRPATFIVVFYFLLNFISLFSTVFL